MHANAGKTVAQILRGKRGSIKTARLDRGSPSWDDIMNMTWEELEECKDRGETGFRTFHKLLSDKRFNK